MRSYDEIKNIRMPDSDKTIGDFLTDLFVGLWDKGERFNSKRPFGTSGWKFEVYAALVSAGIVEGVLDEDNCVKIAEIDKADALVQGAIVEVFK